MDSDTVLREVAEAVASHGYSVDYSAGACINDGTLAYEIPYTTLEKARQHAPDFIVKNLKKSTDDLHAHIALAYARDEDKDIHALVFRIKKTTDGRGTNKIPIYDRDFYIKLFKWEGEVLAQHERDAEECKLSFSDYCSMCWLALVNKRKSFTYNDKEIKW